MGKKLSIAFIWHFHQPSYQENSNGDFLMPWVRLHATKDYLDMLSRLEDFKKSTLKAKDSVAEFVAKNKGVKGIKIAATVLTAFVAAGFAIKELYDIVTKSNPEE